ncbi:type III-B CRISPR module RAMP protein Cmr1 [Chitinivibrio alkaliphilus]|uniref:CRISPR system related protein, RAMP superfamily n=1 Tax=Chitinivibrio alkaliphilus ACht1 TaxID=1313304 RepID=U7D487_9BACT|nr:type III-B CRISPR module RAMP protein Cmr1 [Chitinivibrio alkaliphilus]ERP30778.1 CRISPR system related protein, RAMP superfamily [Chitinivibrio alkaliphilus ACht1]
MTKIDVSRFVERERITVDVEVLTPMFLGGADGNAELRPAPFKAALRYWWRVLYGGNNLKEIEEKIFGCTDYASSFSMVVTGSVKPKRGKPANGTKFKVTSKSKGNTFFIDIIDYLCFGICEKNNYKYTHIPINTPFTLILSNLKEDYKEEITNSLKALLRYGGVGGRARNGMGSLYSSFANDFDITKFFKGKIKNLLLQIKKRRFSKEQPFIINLLKHFLK